MADEEKEEQEASKEKSGGNKLILVIIIILLVLLLLIGGAVAYFLLSSDEESAQNPDQKQEQSDKKEKKRAPSDDLTVGPIYPVDNFVVNLMSDGARRYLKCTINLEMDSAELQPEMDQKAPKIRDITIRILSSKTVEEISTSRGKEKLKEEIKRKINEYLEAGEIKHIYFVEFVIQ